MVYWQYNHGVWRWAGTAQAVVPAIILLIENAAGKKTLAREYDNSKKEKVRKMKKRLLSIVLSLCIVMTFMPQIVFAEDGMSSGVYIFFDSSKFTSWKAPFYAYVYDEDSSSVSTYSNAAFPGQAMQVDPATGYYYIEVSDSSCIAKDKVIGESTALGYDLAHSPNTLVVISDSEERRYPADGARKKLELGGHSKLLSGSDWQSFIPKATISYELNGGFINSGNVTEYIYGQGAALPTDVIKTGYTFAGWYEDDDFSGSPVTKILTTDTGNKTFYAKWDNINDKLISITPPDPITVENGTAYEDMNLPETVEVETSLKSVTSLPVEWKTAGGSYNPDIKTEQTVTLYGILQLPDGLEGNSDGPAYTTITITIKAAPGTSDDSNKDNDSKIDVPDDSNNDNESKADAEDSVKTGDNANLALWLALMILSGAGITGTTLYTRRKRTNE